ncbi:hypothetical protein CEY12_21625 [Chryseobacterium sp. T16E-39]|uniref:hypothetical protein n=1 Tax=Chryseobacterium sp. T16E-39 TaxID=2015076 RepID=UPI000B5B219F|nr:hypothetical protein [Chryseobacterium sp. T16E-39]ASK32525.1 hypothetical protein CEY12_21625 [Chryseobacterium sp. T16E-39]
MIYRIYFPLFFLIIFSNKFYSQVYIRWELDKKKESADITIYNDSKENIIIPIDTLSLQAYFVDSNKISEENWNGSYPFLALTLNVYDSDTQNRIETYSSTPYFDLSQFEKLKNKTDSIQNVHNSLLRKWQRANNIQKDYIAQINYHLFKSLLFIKPKDKIEFSVNFNLLNVTNQENSIHDSYLLEKGKNYNSSLTLNIDTSVYNYLTKTQKQKLKKYRLFTGVLEINKITLQ